MKKLFTVVCGLMMALCMNAKQSLPLTTEGMTCGWNSSYDGATQTIHYVGGWGGRGWYFSQPGKNFDFLDYDYLVVKVASSTVPLTLNVEYTDGKVKTKVENGVEVKYLEKKAEQASELAAKEDKYVAIELNNNAYEYLLQAYIKNYSDGDGTTVLEDAFLCTKKEYDAFLAENKPSAIWEGSDTFGDSWKWETHMDLASNKLADLKAGDVLKFTYTQDEKAPYWQLKLTTSEKKLSKSVVNTYNCIELDKNSTSYSVELTAEDVESLQNKGLFVHGVNVTLTQIAAVSSTTGIERVVATPTSKETPVYNLAGQQVSKSYKGIVIKNGKKMVQK